MIQNTFESIMMQVAVAMAMAVDVAMTMAMAVVVNINIAKGTTDPRMEFILPK